MRLVVLISGSGSNLQALIDACAAGRISANIAAVISNRPHAFGLERARKAGIASCCIDHKQFSSREDFDRALQRRIDSYDPDLVVLAGFMRILTADFTRHYLGRMLNIHPSLLPKYPGLNTHQRALQAGDDCHGVTVHFVTPELDGGPNVVQAVVAIEAGDSPQSLAQRVLAQEHVIYPLAVAWFAEGRLKMSARGCTLDGEPLPPSGVVMDSRNGGHRLPVQ